MKAIIHAQESVSDENKLPNHGVLYLANYEGIGANVRLKYEHADSNTELASQTYILLAPHINLV